MATANEPVWGAALQAIALQIQEAMRPVQAVAAELGRQITVSESAVRSVQAAAAMMAQAAQLPAVRVSEEIGRAARVNTDALAPALAVIAEAAARHRDLRLHLSAEALSLIEPDWEEFEETVAAAPEEWTPERVRLSLEAMSRYVQKLCIVLWLMLIGMIVSSKQVGADPIIVEALEQMNLGATAIALLAKAFDVGPGDE